jgi:copper transport protein
MPGMASPEELDRLQRASPEEADVLFLQLMIPHHEAALPMAEAILERTDRPEVQQLAEAIYTSQQAEIRVINDMLLSMGASPVETEPPQDEHGPHSGHASVDPQETAVSLAHSATLGAIVFLVGLVAFVALVWLPTSRTVGVSQDAVGLFVPWIQALFGLLLVAGTVELSLYAIRASGEPFNFGLLEQVLFDTRVGHIWLARLGLGLLAAIVATWAARQLRAAYWWGAAGIGCVLLVTLTQLSHAAAEGGFLPFLADWVHLIAASLWMGGLLGFPLVLLGPLRAMPPKQREKLRWRGVRRFSRVATLAVMTLIVTGVYATLLHVPSVEGLLDTAYGRALIIKLGLAALLFTAGGVNLVLEGRGPFGRIVGAELILAVGIFVATGFLTTLPPASVASP